MNFFGKQALQLYCGSIVAAPANPQMVGLLSVNPGLFSIP